MSLSGNIDVHDNQFYCNYTHLSKMPNYIQVTFCYKSHHRLRSPSQLEELNSPLSKTLVCMCACMFRMQSLLSKSAGDSLFKSQLLKIFRSNPCSAGVWQVGRQARVTEPVPIHKRRFPQEHHKNMPAESTIKFSASNKL